MMIRKKELIDPALSPIAEEILKRRYLIRDDDGNPTETPKDMFWRVAKTIANVESDYGASTPEVEDYAFRFYNMMVQGYWLPNSPTLMNAGRPLGQLSACFVLPVEDALTNGKDGIYDTLTAMAVIHQGGGGTGFSFNKLRPSGSIVRSTTGVASGPVSFMSLYDASTNVVKQGGVRRGANMGILRVDHPDIEKFINCKQDTSKITNFNISVAITDEFMEQVKEGNEDAVRIWGKICENAWRTGEPGLFFIDEANRHNPVPHLGNYEATNPCAEQPLLPYDVCNLGSLNLSKYVDIEDPTGVDWRHCVDWVTMLEHIKLSTRFLDNVIDANKFPLEAIKERSESIRRTGNGVMGFADFLIKLRIPYDSREALEVADKIAEYFVKGCKEESRSLAVERGVYPAYAGEDETPQRNCNVTTIAPTGTISIIAGCSGGVEPIFAVGFYRNQAGLEALDIHPQFAKDIREKYQYSDEEIGQMALGELPVPKDVSWYRVSSDVSPEAHVRMQAAWQNHICSGISKTINMPTGATKDDVASAYQLAYDLRCKGVTVYRDGCRPGQILSTKKAEDGSTGTRTSEGTDTPVAPVEFDGGRPDTLDGTTHSIDSPVGKMYVTVNRRNGKPYEVFVTVGKAGGTGNSYSEAVGRLISLGLRDGIKIEKIHRQLRGISSDRAYGFGGGKVASGPDAIAKVLENYIQNLQMETGEDNGEFAACPDCHAELHFEEGCYKCHSCGYGGC